MQVTKSAQAGTLESNDILITVAPGLEADGIVIELDSIVMFQYGEAIRKTILETARRQGVIHAFIKAVDRGALDCTIQARVLAALSRAGAVLQEGIV